MMKCWLMLAISGLLAGAVSRASDQIALPTNAPVVYQTNASPARILVEPFISTRWSQWSPYNLYCPGVTNGLSGYGNRTPTGCIPVATAALLRFYSWPSAGIGTDTFNDLTGSSQGQYKAVWTNAIPWETMKDSYSVYCQEDPALVDPLAELLFNLGIAGDTNFEAERSGAFASTLVRKAGQHLNYTVGELLSVQDPRFSQVITNEIHQRRPVLVNINFEGGHTAVADGLAEDGPTRYLHLNFGWGGRNDGWYAGFDVLTNKFFDTVISTVRPSVSAALVSCQPNFFELTVIKGMVPPQTLRVLGCGTNRTDYTLVSSDPWIHVTPSIGIASPVKIEHQVSLDLHNMPPGIHDSFVEIRGNAANLPRKVAFRFYKPDLPSFTEQPGDIVTLYPTQEILYSSAEAGETHTPCPLSNPIEYQWFYNGGQLLDETNAWCQTVGYGVYQCEARNLGGWVRSREAKVMLPPKGIRSSEVALVDGNLQFIVENIQSEVIFIEMSTDLKNWRDAYSFQAHPEQSRLMMLSLPLPSQYKTGFFRLREP